jgi:hypothetical protein
MSRRCENDSLFEHVHCVIQVKRVAASQEGISKAYEDFWTTIIVVWSADSRFEQRFDSVV